MEKASRVMYSIANIFNWILLVLAILGITFAILGGAGVTDTGFGYSYLAYFIVVFIFALIAILMVKKAKAKNTSKGWDIFFIIIGVFESNIFYILGGIFGVLEERK